MKKIFTLLTVIAMIASCQVEEINEESITSADVTLENDGKSLGGYPNSEIIVQYDSSLTESQKQNMRTINKVVSYKKCECADPTLELWEFEVDSNGNLPSGLNIEEVVRGNKGNSGLEGIEFNNSIQHMGEKLGISFGTPDIALALTKQMASNSELTIAILDTGIDYNYFGFSQPFLYNSTISGDSCNENGYEDYIGWDFVNQDNDPFDEVGHGTIISNIIFEKLTAENINFQLLPIKVFDQDGKGKYFDILCGFRYAQNNSDVDIINMSFGWYTTFNTELLDRFIEESQEKVLLTTSAGNFTQDNDVTPHYPSSYSVSNLLAVASLSNNMPEIDLSYFSNFGISSVDIAAMGQDIPFEISQGEYLFVNGTSYSSAYTAAFAGTLFQESNSPQEWIESILQNAVQHSSLSKLKHQSYID